MNRHHAIPRRMDPYSLTGPRCASSMYFRFRCNSRFGISQSTLFLYYLVERQHYPNSIRFNFSMSTLAANNRNSQVKQTPSLLGLIFGVLFFQIVRIFCLFVPLNWKLRLFLSFCGFVIGFAIGRTEVGKKLESFVYGTRMFQQILFNFLSREQAIVKKWGLPRWDNPLHLFMVTFFIACINEIGLLLLIKPSMQPFSLAIALVFFLTYAACLAMYRSRTWINNHYQQTTDPEKQPIIWDEILKSLRTPDIGVAPQKGYCFPRLRIRKPTTLKDKVLLLGATMAGLATPGFLKYFLVNWPYLSVF